MDNRLQATFMPRQSAPSGEAFERRKSPPNFFMLAGVVLFLIVLGLTGGLYAYKNVLTKGNEAKRAAIQDAIRNFEPELTKELTSLKSRMDAAKTLVQNHKAFSLLLGLLEMNTAQTVRFSDFSYAVAPDNKISLSMRGESRTYNAIAFQSDVFSKVPQLKNPMFKNLSLDDKGVISFNVTAELEPSAVAYSRIVSPTAPILPPTIPVLPRASSSPRTATTTAPVSSTTPRS